MGASLLSTTFNLLELFSVHYRIADAVCERNKALESAHRGAEGDIPLIKHLSQLIDSLHDVVGQAPNLELGQQRRNTLLNVLFGEVKSVFSRTGAGPMTARTQALTQLNEAIAASTKFAADAVYRERVEMIRDSVLAIKN